MCFPNLKGSHSSDIIGGGDFDGKHGDFKYSDHPNNGDALEGKEMPVRKVSIPSSDGVVNKTKRRRSDIPSKTKRERNNGRKETDVATRNDLGDAEMDAMGEKLSGGSRRHLIEGEGRIGGGMGIGFGGDLDFERRKLLGAGGGEGELLRPYRSNTRNSFDRPDGSDEYQDGVMKVKSNEERVRPGGLDGNGVDQESVSKNRRPGERNESREPASMSDQGGVERKKKSNTNIRIALAIMGIFI